VYLSAEEEGMMIAQANIQMDATGKITAEDVIVKKVISVIESVQKLIILMLRQTRLFLSQRL
jgi:hypothetical protein